MMENELMIWKWLIVGGDNNEDESVVLSYHSQIGTIMETMGVNLLTPAFSHRQFYVAVSREKNWRRIFILLGPETEGQTKNIVYQDTCIIIM